jgi:hypothetical protein
VDGDRDLQLIEEPLLRGRPVQPLDSRHALVLALCLHWSR